MLSAQNSYIGFLYYCRDSVLTLLTKPPYVVFLSLSYETTQTFLISVILSRLDIILRLLH